MQATQLSADCAVTGAGVVVHATVTVHDGVIAAVEARGGTHERLAGTLLPGMIDLQVNGAGGASVAVRLRNRPWAAVVADMVEGVVVANRLTGTEADRIRAVLWAALDEHGAVAA